MTFPWNKSKLHDFAGLPQYSKFLKFSGFPGFPWPQPAAVNDNIAEILSQGRKIGQCRGSLALFGFVKTAMCVMVQLAVLLWARLFKARLVLILD